MKTKDFIKLHDYDYLELKGLIDSINDEYDRKEYMKNLNSLIDRLGTWSDLLEGKS